MNKSYLYHIIAVILYRPHLSPKALRISGRVTATLLSCQSCQERLWMDPFDWVC